MASGWLITLFCTFARLRRENAQFRPFYGEYKQATTKSYFSLETWICSIGIQLQLGSPTFDKVSGWENRDKD